MARGRLLLYCQSALIMEELIEEEDLLQWSSLTRERGWGESWEEIDYAMRKNLQLPLSLPPLLPLQEGMMERKRQFTELRTCKPRQDSDRRLVLRTQEYPQQNNTRERLKIIRSITSQDNYQPYLQSLRESQGEYKQNSSKHQLQRQPSNLKEVKIDMAGVQKFSLSKHPPQKQMNGLLSKAKQLHLGKQNCFSPALLILNTIHEESPRLEQTITHFPQCIRIIHPKPKETPIRRYHSEGKCEQLPIINIYPEEKGMKSIHANPTTCKQSFMQLIRKSQRKGKSLQLPKKELFEPDRASISKKYKVFLRPQGQTPKLRLN